MSESFELQTSGAKTSVLTPLDIALMSWLGVYMLRVIIWS